MFEPGSRECWTLMVIPINFPNLASEIAASSGKYIQIEAIKVRGKEKSK